MIKFGEFTHKLKLANTEFSVNMYRYYRDSNDFPIRQNNNISSVIRMFLLDLI